MDVGERDGLNVGVAVVAKVDIFGVGEFVALVVELKVGLVVGISTVMSQTALLYVAVEIEIQFAFVASKNPISFHVGRIDKSNPSQTYDRTKFVMFPCPGKLDPNDGVKWYGFGPKYVDEDPHVT